MSDRNAEDLEDSDVEQDGEELESEVGADAADDTDFDTSLGDDDGLDDFDDDADPELKALDAEMSQREQNARSLAIRRAIEQRMEQKKLARDLDYLDLDVDMDD